MEEKRVAIIGGGLAGLACAIALINNGFTRVQVFERDRDFNERRQGYGLTILQGISALRKLGADLYARVEQLDTPSRCHYIFDWHGNIVGFYGTVFWPQSDTSSVKSNKKHNLHISRQNLRRLLREKYQSVSQSDIIWNKRFSEIKYNGEMIDSVCFTDGTEYQADLVIGCDGVNSKVRRFKYDERSDHRLHYLGIIVVLGITYSEHFLAKERVFQTVDGTTRLFAMPFADSEDDETSSRLNIMWQLSFPLDESHARRLAENGVELKEEVLRRCGEWHEPIPSMIKSTDLSLLMGVVAYDRDPSPPSTCLNKSIVLLGDSAHPMSPFKGQGANQALLDAVNFVNRLKSNESVTKAVEEFDSEMFQRVRDKVMLSRERATTYHDQSIIKTENFIYRGVDQTLIDSLKEKNINSKSGESLEQLIINEMKIV